MHEHDPDLIASLAEGHLSQPEALAAEESLARCPECLADLAAQRSALAAIRSAPRPGLSMSESADLRRAVRRAVGAEPEPETSPTRRPWLGLATAAAVVILLLAVAPLVNLLSTDRGQDAATQTTFAEEPASAEDLASTAERAPAATVAPTTAPAATEAPAETMVAEAPEFDAGAGVAEDGAALPQSRLEFQDVPELDQFLTEVPEGLEDRDETRSLTEGEVSYFANRWSATLREEDVPCTLDAATEGLGAVSAVITVGRADVAGVELLVVAVSGPEGQRYVVALNATTCEVLGRVEA